MPENKQENYFHNWISVVGSILSVFFFSVILFLIILDYLYREVNPYLGIFTYLILPGFLIFSLILIPWGAFRERARRTQRGYIRKFPNIDFNNPTHQKWAYTTISVSTLFLLLTLYGSYQAYQYTESVAFCGRVCHTVMEPEYTAYHNSPHARVSCAQCHIGPGADWYVRSKLSGSYQVYSTIFNKYSRPIETPIKNLRPAQETCEQCHWPQQFFGAVEFNRQYYLSDEQNTEWKTRMLMFVGGGRFPHGENEGIHWHMNIKNKIYYVATDDKRQTIPWIRRIDPDGNEEVYIAEGSGYTADNPPEGELRKMDCIDCHNRPSHIYKSPMEAVNEAISFSRIDKTLPFIKREAVKALLGEYQDSDEAAAQIKKILEDFYQTHYPDVWSARQEAVQHSIESITDVYRSNFFPKMKVSWKEYPDNIGHFIFPGCFRCHDGNHKTAEGKVLRNDCNICHNIIEQGLPGQMESSVSGLEFKHPDEGIGDMWKDMNCFDCHTGGAD